MRGTTQAYLHQSTCLVDVARKAAQTAAKHSDASKLTTVDDLVWWVDNNKKKAYPSYYCPAKDMASAKIAANKRAVVHIGKKHTHSALLYESPVSQLVPYYGKKAPEGDEKPQWSPTHLQWYLQSIKNQAAIKENATFNLKVEELLLEEILKLVRENQCKKEEDLKRQAEQAAIQEPESEDEPDNEPSEAQHHVKQAARTAHLHRSDSLPVYNAPKQRLRAGDVILYVDPTRRAAVENERQATIMEVRTLKEDKFVALVLNDGRHIPHDHQIKLVARLDRGKMVPCPESRFRHVNEFILNTTMNGKVEVETLADKMGKIYDETKEQLEKAPYEFLRTSKRARVAEK